MGLVPMKIIFRSSVIFDLLEFSDVIEVSGVGSGVGSGSGSGVGSGSGSGVGSGSG